MLKFAIFLLAILSGTALLAFNAEKILLFHFDETRISPAQAGDARISEVVFDGLILWVSKPAHDKATILYFHGNAGNLAGRIQRFSAFVDHGFGLVAMAYPGSSGSIGAENSQGYQENARTVYAHMEKLIGPSPIIFYGESLGTGIAAQLAAETTPPPAALVLESPYTSILDRGRQLYPRFAPILHWLGNPWVSRDWIVKNTAPLLILHGSLDQVIPTKMGRDLFALAPVEDKTLFIVEGAGHANVWQPNAQQVLYAFLNRF